MTLPKFFQGETLQGPVRASDAKTFRDVVAQLDNPPMLDIDRKAFFALPEEKRNEMKRVGFFVPACFKTSPSPRRLEHITHCNLLFLDIDPEKENGVETGKYPAAPFVNHPEQLHVALSGFNFAAHTTASNAPGKERMRIVVEADGISVADYPRAVRTIGEMLGLGKVTRESRVACQPMFVSVVFRDDPSDFHPMLTSCLTGKAFTTADISDSLTDEYTKARPTGNASDDLEFLRAPIPEITLSTAKEALRKISPDVDRAEWLEVAAALRHQFSPDQAEEAYDLFDEWSSTGEKYNGSDDTLKMWDSLRPTPVGRAPVTIRSLLKTAVANGYDDGKVRETSFEKIVQWIEETKTITELVEQGVKKIMALPITSAIQEGRLIERLRLHAKSRFNEKVLVSDIKEEIVKLRKQIKAQEQKDEKTRVPTWAKGLCYVAATQQFYRQRTGEKYTTKAFNETFAHHLTPEGEDNGSRPVALPGDYVLNTLKIQKVYDFDYDPSRPTDVFFKDGDITLVNTYRPTHPEADAEGAPAAGEMVKAHLRKLFKEREYRIELLNFFAYITQNPGKKIRWAPMIQGAEGCGKTFLSEMMAVVLGRNHIKIIDGETILSGWNEWAFGSQLVVIEEVRIVGTSKHDIMNRLKPWVTNQTIPIKEKFRGSVDRKNLTNYILFSNHADALTITPNNRRYFVLKSTIQTKAQVAALGPTYFTELFKMLEENAGGLRYWLTQWPISKEFNPNGPPLHTPYEKEMAEDSSSELTTTVKRLLMEGDTPVVQYDICTSQGIRAALALDYQPKFTDKELGRVLRDEGFVPSKGRNSIGDERQNVWRRQGMDENEALVELRRRVKEGLKNMEMEIYFS